MNGEAHCGRIVVGTDGSPGSVVAVRWAAEAARHTDSLLDVVFVWTSPVDFGWLGAAPLHGWQPEPAAEGHSLLAEVLDHVGDETLLPTVRTLVMKGDPARCLIAHATGADLLVLGDRGAGGFLGLQLGSVASICVAHAACPVLIVPSHRQRQIAEEIPSRARAASSVAAAPAASPGVPHDHR